MSDVTLTRAEHEVLTGAKALMDKLLTGKTKRDAQRLIKQAAPDIEIHTDDEILEPVAKDVDDLRKEIKELKNALSDKEIDENLESEFNALTKSGFQPEGIEEVKKIMIERKIKSPLDAAAIWEKRNPPAPQLPTGFQSTKWDFGETKGDDLKEMFSDEDAYFDKQATRIWAEETAKNQIKT